MTAATKPEGQISRPEVTFDAIQHKYKVEGRDVLGVSTIAKIGGAESAFNIASAWGFRIGYEGAMKALNEAHDFSCSPVARDADELRAALQSRGLTPWSTRDKAAERGSWVHDVLEELGQGGDVPDLVAFAERHGEEAAGHARSVLRWFLEYRPKFVAMEVQVASVEHGFAGRYDVRAKIDARRLLRTIDPLRTDPAAVRIRELAARGEEALGLIDLKTSKGVYPETHFPQLEGYEGAGVEMGFPATDFRAVLNTWPSGEHEPERDMVISWSCYEDFLGYLLALRAIRRIQAADPAELREAMQHEALLANLPNTSRKLSELGLSELEGLDSRAIGRALGKLRKRGQVEQGERGVWQLVS